MTLRDKLSIELSMEDIYGTDNHYARLVLPATEGQIEDAIQRVRGTGRSEQVGMKVIACRKLPALTQFRLDSPSLKELNFLAERIEKLNEERTIALQAVFSNYINKEGFQEPISMKELINMTYGLEKCYVMTGMQNDSELGDFVIDGELMESIKNMDDEGIEMLNPSAVGAKYREKEKGIYIKGNYVATAGYGMPEIYDGKTLPASEYTKSGGGFITMRVANSGNPDPLEAEKNAVLIGLPIDRAKADEIAESLGEKRIEDCVYFDFQSPVSWIDDELYGDTQIFDKLNSIAQQYESLTADDKIKFKAVSQNENCRDLDHAKRIMDDISRYQISHYTADYKAYAKEYMRLKLPTEFDAEVLEGCDMDNLGRRLCDRLECGLTGYGIVSKKGRTIFETVREIGEDEEIIDAEQEEGMGGLQT